jgi:hypothetical protein
MGFFLHKLTGGWNSFDGESRELLVGVKQRIRYAQGCAQWNGEEKYYVVTSPSAGSAADCSTAHSTTNTTTSTLTTVRRNTDA